MKNESRTGFTVINILTNLADKGLLALLKFITRVVFVKMLGKTLLGVSGLFSNVLGTLALAELGIGTAITYSLYEPCAKNDDAKILSLMKVFRKAYRVISLVVATLGVMIMPFLPKLIAGGEADTIPHFYAIYLLFLFNMAVEYLFSYKRTLAVASQKNYLTVPIIMVAETVMCGLQISVLVLFRKSPYCYLLYLCVQSLTIVVQNIVLNRYLDKKFPILKNISTASPLESSEKKSIVTNIKALIYHKIGGFAVTSTDNILISAIISIGTVGIYSNYSSIIVTVTGIIYIFIGNATASFGNLIVKESPEKRRSVFEELQFFYSFIYTVATAIFISVFTPFIRFVYGESFLLGTDVVFLVVFANAFMLGMASVLDVVKSAAGLYDKDKWVPLVQAASNLIISIILGKTIGLLGIFIGTAVSTLVPLIAKPFVVYKYVFESKPKKYFISLVKDSVVCILISLGSFCLTGLAQTGLGIADVAVSLIISFVLGCAVFCLVNFKSPYFPSLFGRIKSILKGVRG